MLGFRSHGWRRRLVCGTALAGSVLLGGSPPASAIGPACWGLGWVTFPKNTQGTLTSGGCNYIFQYGEIYGIAYSKVQWTAGSNQCREGTGIQGWTGSTQIAFFYPTGFYSPLQWIQVDTRPTVASAISSCYEYGIATSLVTSRRSPW